MCNSLVQYVKGFGRCSTVIVTVLKMVKTCCVGNIYETNIFCNKGLSYTL